MTNSFESTSTSTVTVIGGGLAGCEAAWQLARQNIFVRLIEMKPIKLSPAHHLDSLAELVCSNSLRSDNLQNAVGLLHAELRGLGSLVLQAADATRVPAGDALAVDRIQFSQFITEAIKSNPRIKLIREEAKDLLDPPNIVVVATGPLTSDALANKISQLLNNGAFADKINDLANETVRAVNNDQLYFYDALAPIVAADSVDESIAFRASRYGKGGGDHYLNLPLDKERYDLFVESLIKGEKVVAHGFEEPRYFEGCLPIEVMAERGPECLAHGPMKPVGLIDPRTGKRPYAVVQLRAENKAGSAYNLVGFQTRLTWSEQQRIFRQLPGLEKANFLRLGQIHRNTFLNSPKLLSPEGFLKSHSNIYFAGQITGVEGYVESTASGFMVALAVAAKIMNKPYRPFPEETALGALHGHVTGQIHPADYCYQPSNVTFALFPPLEGRVRKNERRALMISRAQKSLDEWMGVSGSRDTTDNVC